MKMDSSRTTNSSRNILLGGIDKCTAIFFPFIIRTVFIRKLGIEYLGLGSLFTSILDVLNLADLGFSSAICSALYAPIARNEMERVNSLLLLFDRIYKIIGSIVLFAGLAVMPFLKLFIKGGVPENINIYYLWIIYLSQTVVSYLVFAYRGTLLYASQRADISSGISAFLRFLCGILQIILIIQVKSLYVYAAINLLYTLLNNCMAAVACKHCFPQYQKSGTVDNNTKKTIMQNTGALALQKIGNTLSVSLDPVVISSFLGLSVVAIYGNYYYIIGAIDMFISLTVVSVTASIGNSLATETIEKNYYDFMKIFLIHSWIVGWCCVCLMVLMQDFMIVWVGDNLLFSISVLLALIIRFYFHEIRRVVLNYKDAAGLWIHDRWKSIVGCAVNLILSIISVRFFGVIGVAISTVIDFAVVELPWETSVLFKQFFKNTPKGYYYLLIKSTICIFLNICFVYYISTFIPLVGLKAVFAKGILCLLIPNILFYIEMRNEKCFNDAKLLVYNSIQTLFGK